MGHMTLVVLCKVPVLIIRSILSTPDGPDLGSLCMCLTDWWYGFRLTACQNKWNYILEINVSEFVEFYHFIQCWAVSSWKNRTQITSFMPSVERLW